MECQSVFINFDRVKFQLMLSIGLKLTVWCGKQMSLIDLKFIYSSGMPSDVIYRSRYYSVECKRDAFHLSQKYSVVYSRLPKRCLLSVPKYSVDFQRYAFYLSQEYSVECQRDAFYSICPKK